MYTIRLLFLVCLCNSINTQAQYSDSFSKNQNVYLFGDNVKLRNAPSTDAEVIKLLPIGTQLSIQSKIEEKTYTYDGIVSNWYKVVCDGIEGYTIGALLSRDKHISLYDSSTYFVYHLSEEHADYTKRYVHIRMIKNGEIKNELKLHLFGSGDFDIVHSNNKGIDNMKDLIIIDNYSESCGVDGGKSYVVNTGDKLLHMANTTQIADGGMFHSSSSFTFPMDEGGQEDVIIYKEEQGTMLDEDTNWYKTNAQERYLKWNGSQLMPPNYAIIVEE